jgi:hypothetical protein
MDLFAVGKDGAVYTTSFDQPQNRFDATSGWSGQWSRVGDTSFGDGFTLPLNTPIGCLALSPDNVDLFAVGKDGAVYTTLWVSNGGWIGQWRRVGDPGFGDGFTLPLNTPIGCLARTADHVDLFAVGKDSAVYSTFFDRRQTSPDPSDGWSGQWFRLGDPGFGDGFTLPPFTPIGCLARTADRMDLFAVGKDSAVYNTTFFDSDTGG